MIKLNNNLKISNNNLSRIKKLEKIETQIMDKLKETYQQHDELIKQYDFNVNRTIYPLNRESSKEFMFSPQNRRQLKPLMNDDIPTEAMSNGSQTRMQGSSQSPDKSQTIVKTQRANRYKPVNKSLFYSGMIDQEYRE
jgi:hypothetical protein